MNLFDLYARIVLDTSDYEKGLSDAGEKTSSFSDNLKTGLATAVKVGVAAITAASTAVTFLTKNSLEQYSEYEQLVGGVETLFKTASNTVLNYAQNAYKTAGLSANQYMSTVTSFSASLLQSLGNDTAAAAAMADLAITDMADNANKMGTSIESIQTAYQGFAKQNYTMLDNLKLGYGGTKTEMERLLADAEELKAANGEMVSYSIDSFADMVEAIHVVQTEMGITGTTAAEASSTIEGAISSMKAAWENLSTGMADETANMENLAKNFVDSVGTAANNIIPRVGQIVTGIGTASVEVVSYLRDTNSAIDMVVTGVEDITVAAGTASTVIAGSLAGAAVKNVATVFMANAEALAYFTVESGAAAVAEATLSGTFSVSEIVVGVLTGKIKLATAAQYAWNTAMNANPIMLVATAAGLLGVAIHKSISEVDAIADSMVIQAETSEEAAANLEKLRQKFDEFEGNPNKWGAEKRQEYLAVKQAIEETEAQIAELQKTEEAAAVAAEGSADSMEETAAESEAAAAELLETWQTAYQSFYDNLYNAANVLTSVNEKTKITAEEAQGNLEKNTQFYSEMGSNLEYVRDAAEESGVNIGDLLQALSEMSTSDAAGTIAAIRQEMESLDGDTEAQAAKLQEWADGFTSYAESVSGVATFFADATTGIQVVTDTISQASETIQVVGEAVTNAQSEVSQTVALNNENIVSEMIGFRESWEDIISGLDKSKEARSAAEATFQAFADGMNNKLPAIISQAKKVGQEITKAIQSGIGKITATVDVVVNSSMPGYATGLDFVPYDNYLAYLHKGEAVLTASEAAAWRAGKDDSSTGSSVSGGSPIINQFIETVPQTPAEIAAATAAYFELARWTEREL